MIVIFKLNKSYPPFHPPLGFHKEKQGSEKGMWRKPEVKLIIYFEILIGVCIFLLILRSPGSQALAEKLAIYAYYCLSAAVLISFIRFIIERKSEDEDRPETKQKKTQQKKDKYKERATRELVTNARDRMQL